MTGGSLRNSIKLYSDDIICFSFTKKDIEILLFFYNYTYFAFWILTKGDFKVCFLAAYLVSFVALFVFVLIDIFEKIDEEKEITKAQRSHVELQKKLREEYRRIYKSKKIHELLTKAMCLGTRRNIVPVNRDSNSSSSDRVHFDYLNRFGTSGLHKEIQGS